MLKAAQKEFQKGNIDAAIVAVENILEENPNNYNALLIQGKCYEKEDPTKSLGIYEKAGAIDPDKAWAWKGAVQCATKLKNCTSLLTDTMNLILALENTDGTENRPAALDSFQSASQFITQNGSAADKKALAYAQLHGSPIYDYLGPLFAPQHVILNKLLDGERKALKEELNKLQGRARNNISFTARKINDEKLKIYQSTEVPALLQKIIDVVPEDEKRRAAEVELLEFKYKVLKLSTDKSGLAVEVKRLADDMVLFKSPKPLAYIIHWDWSDFKKYSDLDVLLIKSFIELFPLDGLTKILDAFLHSPLSPFKLDEEDSAWAHQDIMDALKKGHAQCEDSIFANRIVTDFFVYSELYEKAALQAKEGLRLANALAHSTSISLPTTKIELSLAMATAFIYYQPPKNFDAARHIFKSVLEEQPDNEAALTGSAQLLAESHHLDEALKQFEVLVERFPDNYTVLSELSWCQIRLKEYGNAKDNILKCLDLALLQGSAQQIANRCALLYWRLGYSYWLQDDMVNAFDSFANALRENPSYAPAYSYLGLLYQRKGDNTRSVRCFYKALEIDPGEIIAAHCLVSNFAAESQWDVVEIITASLLESGRTTDPLSGERIDWPYRVMGIVCLNRKDYAEAVAYFQRCLRLSPNDANSWVGLGEAYIHSGRYLSAEKALGRALELEPENLTALYELSLAHRETRRFNDAAAVIKKAISLSPVPALKGALVDNYSKAANSYLFDSQLGDALDTATEGLKHGLEDLKENKGHGTMWASIASCIKVFLEAQGHPEKYPVETLREVASLAGESFDETSLEKSLCALTIATCTQAHEHSAPGRGSRAAATYNLGLAYYQVHLILQEDSHLQTAIKHLQKALTLENRNFEYWNTYGVIIQSLNPRIAHHCFIRSLTLFSRSPATWTNLGLLYLEKGDLELASEAFDRALSVDPDESTAWIGQALGDYISGKTVENVLRLFENSYLISSGKDKLARLFYGIFASENAHKTGNVDHNAVGALQQLRGLDPKIKLANLSYASLLERAGDYDEALHTVRDVAEDAQQHSQLARLYLARRDWELAIEHASIALELEPEDEMIQLSCMLTTGLAQYFTDDLMSALDTFTAALELSEESQDVVVLLSQVLWGTGGEDERSAATDQLFESIQSKGPSVRVSLVLGVIGLLNKDKDIIDATAEELDGFHVGTLSNDSLADVSYVLSQLQDSKAPLYRALFYSPTNYDVWKHVDTNTALSIAKDTCSDCTQISEAYASVDGLENARRAVFYSPASKDAWVNLARCGAEAH